jgi:hypothetical protein
VTDPTDPGFAAVASTSAIDAFNYLSVLIAIILGLAITQILKGFRGLALSRARVISYWPTLVLAGLLLLINVQGWWASFGMREIRIWTFPMFAVVLMQTTLTYMLAALVLPDFFGEKPVDLHEHYFAHRQLFFGLFVVTLLVSLSKDWVLSNHLPDRTNIAFHCGFIVLTGTGALTAREWYHKALAVAGVIGFGAYIALLFTQLR